MLGDVADSTFTLGKVVLKLKRAKTETSAMLRSLEGSEEERVLVQRVGKYWNTQRRRDRPDGLVVVTSHRFAFLTQIKTIVNTTDFLSFPHELIQAPRATRVMLVSPAVQFDVQDTTYTFTLFANAQAVVDVLTTAISERLGPEILSGDTE
jgi:hypothetical protein